MNLVPWFPFLMLVGRLISVLKKIPSDRLATFVSTALEALDKQKDSTLFLPFAAYQLPSALQHRHL